MLIENTVFELNELAEDTIDVLTIKAFEKELELILRIDPDLPTRFMGDPVRIKQVIVNLLSNAIKFTAKGEIFVNIRKEGSIASKPGANDLKNLWLSIDVKDTGIGIPPEKI